MYAHTLQTELERLRHENSEATQRLVSSSEELSSLREEAMYLRSEVAGLKLSHGSARQDADLLRWACNWVSVPVSIHMRGMAHICT